MGLNKRAAKVRLALDKEENPKANTIQETPPNLKGPHWPKASVPTVRKRATVKSTVQGSSKGPRPLQMS